MSIGRGRINLYLAKRYGGALGPADIADIAEDGKRRHKFVTKRAIVDGTADLSSRLVTAAGPTHLLRFVHSSVDQEIGGAFSD